MKTKAIIYLLMLAGIFFFEQNASAQDEENYKCLQVEAVYGNIKGSFDGEGMLIGDEDGYLLPKLEYNYGFGISYGIINAVCLMGLKYSRSQYDASFLNESIGKAKYNQLGMDIKIFYPFKRKDELLERPVLQAYFLTGFLVGFLKVENGCITSNTNANFVSFGAPLGVGFAVNPFRPVSLNFGISYRLAATMSVSHPGSEGYSVTKTGMGGLVCSASLVFYWGSENM